MRQIFVSTPDTVEVAECNKHPDAPHGFARNSSHMMDRYVCECEGWIPDECVKYPDDEEED